MNAVGIDISKAKSMIAVMQPLRVVVAEPIEISHTESELKELARFLKSLPGETKVVMESTGRYSEPIARYLHDEGLFVSVVNAMIALDAPADDGTRRNINNSVKMLFIDGFVGILRLCVVTSSGLCL